jgi:DNA-binding transcriptional LysR family regulator
MAVRRDRGGVDPARPLDLLLLQTFHAVVRAGTMRAAAAALHVSQPAVTARMREFERRIGTPLFERAGRRLLPSPAGRLLLEHGKRVLAEEAALRERIDRLVHEEHGTLRLATIDAVSIYVLPQIYLEFRARHPGIDLRVRVADSRQVLQALRDRDVDVGVLALPHTYPQSELHADVEVTPIYRDRMVCVAAPEHPLAAQRRCPIAQIARYPLVLYDPGSITRAILDAEFASHGLAPIAVMETTSPEAMKRLAQVGVGIAVLPEALVAQDVAAGLLRRLETPDARFERTLATAVLRGRDPGGPASRFLELVYARWRPLPAPPAPPETKRRPGSPGRLVARETSRRRQLR